MNKGEQTRALIRDLLSLNEEERSPLSDPTTREAEERRSRRMRIGQELVLHLEDIHHALRAGAFRGWVGVCEWSSLLVPDRTDEGTRIKREILHDQNDKRPYALQVHPL